MAKNLKLMSGMRTLKSSQYNFVTDGFGGLVFYQDKGRTTSSDHRKKLLMLMSAIVSLLTIAADYSLGQLIAISRH
jgi:hypothetical protein